MEAKKYLNEGWIYEVLNDSKQNVYFWPVDCPDQRARWGPFESLNYYITLNPKRWREYPLKPKERKYVHGM